MNWQGKPIDTLTDDELRDAIYSVGAIDANRVDKLLQPRKRHQKLFDAHPPVENPVFIQLAAELNEQFKLRELKEFQNA